MISINNLLPKVSKKLIIIINQPLILNQESLEHIKKL